MFMNGDPPCEKMKDKGYMVILRDKEKVFDKTSFHNRSSQQLKYRKNVLEHNQGHLTKYL